MRRLLLVAGTLLAAGCQRPIEVGSIAPDFRAIDIGTGETVSFGSEYRGHVTLVNIWATWCIPCREEIPALDSLHRALEPRGFRVMAVSIDQGDSQQVRDFIEEFGVAFDVLHDPDGTIQQIYQTRGVPESFLVDREGRIRRIVYGAHPWSSPANRRIVSTLLDQEGRDS